VVSTAPSFPLSQSAPESMFIVNEWAAQYFQDILHNHVDGVAVGMQYFRSRGFRDDIIHQFQLGFDLNDRQALAHTALEKGYKEEFLLKTGICYKTEHGELIDRYAGRVMFPWIGVSGKVVGFGGRLLDARTKGVNQKYVNSPESDIYHKDHELYGIYQAKKAIAKEDRVYMVEGYTDVISMHQCGIENVVANSGTALSIHQIHTLHRFTSNITLLYDGDAAGIHAAMRGTDMLLSEGMNLKVLLLPDGDDPDSFSRKHTASDFKKYIEDHQTDFIQFKTDLLLRDERDPLKRSEAINSIVKSISVIQNQILRDTYLQDCAQRMGINEVTLINQMNRFIRNDQEQMHKEVERKQEQMQTERAAMPIQPASPMVQASKVEQMLIQTVVRNGERIIYNNVEDDEGRVYDLTVAQYIDYTLGADKLSFKNPLYNQILKEAVAHSGEADFHAEPYFIHHADIEISKIATALSVDPYQLIRSQKKKPEEDAMPVDEKKKAEEAQEALRSQTVHLILDFQMDYVEQHMKDLKREISLSANDSEKVMRLLAEYKDMQQLRDAMAKKLGNNIIA
jgi:DNA primase